MVSPEFSTTYDQEAAHATADFDHEITPKEHLTAQAFIRTAADQLNRNINADSRRVDLENISLSGGVPLSLQGRLGAGYRTASIRIAQTPNIDKEPALQISLHGSQLNPDMVITTDTSPAKSATEKFFWAKYVDSKSDDYLHGENVCELLDSILKTGGTLANSTDPRKRPMSFNGFVSLVEQLGKKRAPAPTETFAYSTDGYDFAVAEGAFLPYERNACLRLSIAGNIRRYSLEIFGLNTINMPPDHHPVDVTKRVFYSFELAKTATARNLLASVALSSVGIQREALQASLQMPNRHWQPMKSIHQAVHDIYATKTA